MVSEPETPEQTHRVKLCPAKDVSTTMSLKVRDPAAGQSSAIRLHPPLFL